MPVGWGPRLHEKRRENNHQDLSCPPSCLLAQRDQILYSCHHAFHIMSESTPKLFSKIKGEKRN